jgi:anti-sigma factor RsiW
MADLFTGELRARDRLELEAHADGCARCDAALRDLGTISMALDRAYAPLRQRGTLLSSARVRLAARVDPLPTVPWWRGGSVGRLSEATMALGLAALVLGGSLELASVKPYVPPSAPSVIRDYFRTQPPPEETAYMRWLRLRANLPEAATVVYPVGGLYDAPAATESTGDDWLSTGAPR